MKSTFRVIACIILISCPFFHQASAAEAEGTIAVNPTDHKNLVAAIISLGPPINSIRVQYSFDGGQNWTNYGIISGSITAGDPVVVFDPDGVAYLVYQYLYEADLRIHKSTDGGVTWSNAVVISYNYPDEKIDRPWMAISPLRNANGKYDIYIAHLWEGFLESEDGSHIIRIAKSVDGAETFDPDVGLTGVSQGNPQGASIAVGPSGIVYVALAGYDPATNAVELIKMARSTNGGVVFVNHHEVMTAQIGGHGEEIGQYYVKQGLIRADSYPHIAVDPISEVVYVAWAGQQSTANVLMVKSTDLGITWSSQMPVDQGLDEQWMPAISVSPDQVLSVLYYSTPNTTSDPVSVKFAYSTNGGGSFISNPLGSGFAISGTTFLGDYQGLASILDKGLAYYTRGSSPSGSFVAKFIPALNPANHAKVLVDQLDEQNSSFEKFARWNQGQFTYYKPPHRFVFPHNSNEVLRAKQDFKIGTTEKYNEWVAYSDVVNHQTFQIFPDIQPIRARFQAAHNATIRTELIDGGSGGNVEFRDPWLIDFNDSYGPRNRGQQDALWYTHPSPFVPGTGTNYKGVFLNEDFNIPGNPYYSIGAPSQQISGFTWNLLNWTVTQGSAEFQNPNAAQTGVVFQSANTTVTARMKAHLGSSVAEATSTNSQRKMVKDNGTPYFLAYESSGEGWLTESSDASSWSAEQRISDGAGGYGAISIAAAGFLVLKPELVVGDLYAIYNRLLSGTTYQIFLSEKRQGVWQTQAQVSAMSFSSSIPPRPVIGRTDTLETDGTWSRRQLVAVWNANSGITGRLATWTNGAWSWRSEQQLAGAGNRNPSVSSAKLTATSTPPYLYITYDNNNDIFMKPYGGNWNQPLQTVPASISPTSYAPQVVAKIEGTYPKQHEVHVVWEKYQGAFTDGGETWNEIESSPPVYRVMYQGKVGSSWGAAQEWQSTLYNYKRPSVVNLSSGNIVVTWDNGTNVYRTTRQGGVWSTPVVAGPGVHANLVQHGANALLSEARYVAMGASGPPFALQVSGPYTRPELTLSEQYSRIVVAARTRFPEIPLDTAAHCDVELDGVNLKLNDGTVVPLSFVQVHDSLAGFTEDNAWSHLATGPTTLPSTVDSILIDGTANVFAPFGLFGLGDIALRLNFELVDARDSSVVRRLGNERVFSRDTLSLLSVRERLNGLAGREVFVRPTLTGIAKRRKNIVYTLVHVHTVIEDSALAPRSLVATAQQPGVVPTAYALDQNYPNPFNPSTIIRYQIPEDSYVSLKVYDVLGREVASLVDGQRETGYYEASFDASSLGSGVYFYRMQAGRYSAVKKVMVVK